MQIETLEIQNHKLQRDGKTRNKQVCRGSDEHVATHVGSQCLFMFLFTPYHVV